jgi:tRNA A37 threonylcarbamoyladenosine synthetase subunit TsaC/SUA5/YrdC
VARLPRESQYVLDAVGAVAATSANEPGELSPAALEDVSTSIRAGCGAELDAGRLSGLASTVIDFTGSEPEVRRVGAGDPEEAIALVSEALSLPVV